MTVRPKVFSKFAFKNAGHYRMHGLINIFILFIHKLRAFFLVSPFTSSSVLVPQKLLLIFSNFWIRKQSNKLYTFNQYSQQ